MRTIEFNNEDIKECKLALVNQNLTSLQSAFLMQHITNLEQTLNEIRKIIYKNRKHYKIYSTEIEDWMYIKDKFILQIIDKVLGDEK